MCPWPARDSVCSSALTPRSRESTLPGPVLSVSSVACDLLWRRRACHCSLLLMQQEAMPPTINACPVMPATAARGSDLNTHLSPYTNSGCGPALMGSNILQGWNLWPNLAASSSPISTQRRKKKLCINSLWKLQWQGWEASFFSWFEFTGIYLI